MKGREIFKRILLTPAMAALIPIVFVAFFYWSLTRDSFWRPYGDRGKVYETQETSNGKFKVRVDARHETGVYMGGAYYIFHSAPVGSDEWREFLWHRVDDPKSISREMFRFVNDKVGYVSTSQAFAVTTDGSRSWSVWKPTEELKDWEYSYKSIKEVRIEPDGKGRMVLSPFHDKQGAAPELHSSDYGHHWSVVQVTAKPDKSSEMTSR